MSISIKNYNIEMLVNRQMFGDEAIQAAFDAADGNDGVDWTLLENKCPDGVELGLFIDFLVGAYP